MRLPTLSFRASLLLLLGLIFCSALSISVYMTLAQRRADTAYVQERLEAHVKLITQRQSEMFHGTQQFLKLLASIQEIHALADDPDCQQILIKSREMTAYFDDVLIVDPRGDVLCNARASAQIINIADRAYFVQALASQAPVIGQAIIGRTTQRWVLPFALAFRNAQGQVRGVIDVVLNLNWVNHEFAKGEYADYADLALVDHQGTVLAHYPDPDALISKNIAQSTVFRALQAQQGQGTTELVLPQGEKRIYAFSRFAETPTGPIYLWVGLQKDRITAKADHQFLVTLSITLVVAALAFLAAWYGAERLLTRPVMAMAAAARRLSLGDHTARTGLPHVNGEIGQLAQAVDEMALSLVSKSEILRLNRALKVLSECNKQVAHATNEKQLLHDICRTLVEQGGYRLVWVGEAEVGPDKRVLPVAYYGQNAAYLDGVVITWDEGPHGQGPTGTAIRVGAPQVNQNSAANPRMLPWREMALKHGFRSSSAFPLRWESQVLGALTIYSEVEAPFNPAETQLLEDLADDLALGMMSLRLQEQSNRSRKQLEDSLEATIQAMGMAMELRDPYTAGHQQRVGALAAAIAQEMGLSPDEIHGIHLAAIVHDLGKIQIPAELLVKPTALDALEYKLLQRHAQASYDILKGISFPWPIAEMVWQHHERLDGSGYPRGLHDADILLGARILAVSDVVEAMASHRPYRSAKGIDAALAEIRQHSGTRYDAAVVQACGRLFEEGRFTFQK